ncbi:MAG: pyridoxal-phosphate dependent enzyme [Myxococcales bacterium]|nr:pyridoxal-phosphate dependent enzyme [Myxococcales bacterium]
MTDNTLTFLASLEAEPRLGWAQAAPVVQKIDSPTLDLGAQSLWVVRDDATTPLLGGSKVRKLDYLLADPQFCNVERLATMGAIGSGHLVACTAAAQLLGKSLEAHVFWEPLTAGAVDSLGYVVSYSTAQTFYRGRVALALTAPSLLLRSTRGASQVIPAGGTHPVGMLGMVRGGLQVGVRIANGEIPVPSAVYVAFGSGGTAVGLAAGLGLAGVKTTVFGVLAVEPILASSHRLRSLQNQLRRELCARLGSPSLPAACAIVLDRAQVGRGYGWPTPAALTAVESAQDAGFPAEPVYTGKALAALLDHARRHVHEPNTVLFWNTVRRPQALPSRANWDASLPSWLRNRLGLGGKTQPRRKFVVGMGLAAVALTAIGRQHLAVELSNWHGQSLDKQQAGTLHAACEALLPPLPPVGPAAWPWLPVVEAIDNYVSKMPAYLRKDVALLLACVADTPMISGHFAPFSGLARESRLIFVQWLGRQPQLLRDAHVGLVSLVMLGAYQLPQTWAALAYSGPLVASQPRPPRPSWDRLHAPPGSLPAGLAIG